MKKSVKTLLMISLSSTLFIACTKEEDNDSTPKTITYGNLLVSEVNLLGGQTNASIGSFYSCTEDSIYFTNTAGLTLNQGKIDLVYYFGSQTGDSSVIASPKDVVFTNTDDQNPHKSIKTWTTKNNTTFLKLNISPMAFMALKNDSLFLNDLDSNVTATKITKLKVGDVVGFKTQAGKFGAYHVREINNTDAISRAIVIDVKVQE
jgi:hypothetical protein